ncbi:MAG: hypothetical protein M3Y85_04690 [Bacteroidota bacterium]|nr:hypothetical protein [Bacteroidota bacterium]
MSGNMLPENGNHFLVIGIKGNRAYLTDYYVHLYKNDSANYKEFVRPKEVINYIKTTLPALKSEDKINKTCFNKMIAVDNKDTLIMIKDLWLDPDVNSINIEYKIDGKKGVIQQINPALAMTICPDNNERKKLFDFIQYLNSYTNTPLKL